MKSNRFWKPVGVGAVILALSGCLFSAFVINVATCPGFSLDCMPSIRMLVAVVLFFGWPTILGGAFAGAIFGIIYAVIRRETNKGREAVEHSG